MTPTVPDSTSSVKQEDGLKKGTTDRRGRDDKVGSNRKSQVVFPTVSTHRVQTTSVPSLVSVPNQQIQLHPSWSCKRDGCTGQLTLIGDVKTPCNLVENARKRAQYCKSQPKSFYWHGSMLSCSVCGDRPKTNKRRKMWQRLCVICGEPFAMNSFWKCHGGMTNKGETHTIDSRVAVHKRMMREWAQCHKTDVKVLSSLMDTEMEEFKWLAAASQGIINPMVYPISSEAMENIPQTYLMIQNRSVLFKAQQGPGTVCTPFGSIVHNFPPPPPPPISSSRSYQHSQPIHKRRRVDSPSSPHFDFPKLKILHTSKSPEPMMKVFSSGAFSSPRWKDKNVSPASDPGLSVKEKEEEEGKISQHSLKELADVAMTL